MYRMCYKKVLVLTAEMYCRLRNLDFSTTGETTPELLLLSGKVYWAEGSQGEVASSERLSWGIPETQPLSDPLEPPPDMHCEDSELSVAGNEHNLITYSPKPACYKKGTTLKP